MSTGQKAAAIIKLLFTYILFRLGDRLVVYCATSHISIYQLDFETAATVPTVTKVNYSAFGNLCPAFCEQPEFSNS